MLPSFLAQSALAQLPRGFRPLILPQQVLATASFIGVALKPYNWLHCSANKADPVCLLLLESVRYAMVSVI